MNLTRALLHQQDRVLEDRTFSYKVNGFEYQIEQAMACLAAGKLCSHFLPHANSLAVIKVMDEARRQMGLQYSQALKAI
ncbi:MAG: hypothetical protein ACI965_000899 [Paraglaciecola sp.]